MKLTEKHIIKRTHDFYKEIDNICFLSKNLYNAANYIVRQEFINTSKEVEEGKRKHAEWIRYNTLCKMMKDNPDYCSLPRKVSQWVLQQVDDAWKSFFVAIKVWKANSGKFLGRPALPRYKDKQKGRNILQYTIQAISKSKLRKGILKLSGTNIEVKILHSSNINQARIVPLKNKQYKIEIIYEKEIEPQHGLDPNKIAAIDIGINNLAAITSNIGGGILNPILVNGRPLKSINQYFNKRKSFLLSQLMFVDEKRRTSKQIEILTAKRNGKMDDYLHKASKFVIDTLLFYGIGTLVIGKNDNWKQNSKMNDKVNQNFVQIPFARFIEMLTYKATLKGINIIIREEAHTSKCSFLDFEPIKHHDKYMGRRLKRGLFISANKIEINADCNGSGNILRKEFPNAFAEGIEGVVVRPVKVHEFVQANHKHHKLVA